MNPIEKSLNVGVVGGGIGGLCAAISLRDAGHQVTVYERHASTATSRMYNPLGSSLTMGANITRILDSWNFDFDKSGATVLLEEHVFQDNGACELKLLKQHDFGYTKAATGFDWLVTSHHGLHDGLLHIALTTPAGKPPITLHTGTEVTDLDCEAGQLTLANGSTPAFDLVVVSDGVGSRLIDRVTAHTTPAPTPGRTAYRFRVPASAAREDATLGPLLARPRPGMTNFVAPAHGVFLLIMEADARDTFYGLLMHPAIAACEGDSARWDMQGSRAELARLAEQLHAVPRRFCEMAQAPHLWTISTRPPLGSCVRGRAVAIGDACHPHLPHHGQGAASAAEDATSLGVFVHGGVGVVDVPKALEMWEEFRLPRARTVQMIASTYPTPLEKLECRIRDECGYHGPLPENVNGHEPPVQTWLFNYDVVEEAKKHLASMTSTEA